ncbi:DgyrCDS6226 [Dimorphilus gyrociliatus]|nr:DgyrCDS6226 [Dimorphilus gyrociliatus]
MVLADLGADVIKVERTGAGDDSRTWIPPTAGSESLYFLAVNRNKKSIAVDFSKKEGAELVRQLAKQSDVLIENFLPGKLRKFNLDYESLKAINNELIYCSITGYGQTGPYKDRGGYDVIAAAVGGLLSITGQPEGEPCKVGVPLTDIATGLFAHGAIISALLERKESGRGRQIDCSLLSVQVACLIHIAANYLNNSLMGKRYGTAHPSIVPYQAFQTKDGHFVMGGGNNKSFKEICQRLRLDYLSDDDRFVTNEKRVANREELVKIITDRMKEKTNDEWVKALDGATFPYGPVNNMEKVFNDQQVLHNELIEEMNHPKAGSIKLPAHPVRYDNKAHKFRTAPPCLGEHTNEVLTNELNMSDNDIRDLKNRGIIQ